MVKSPEEAFLLCHSTEGKRGQVHPFIRKSYQYSGIGIDHFLKVITFQHCCIWVQSSQTPAFWG